MFCQPKFITNTIFAFLNASIDWIKKIVPTETTLMCLPNTLFLLDTMEIYAKMLLYFPVAKIVWIILL